MTRQELIDRLQRWLKRDSGALPYDDLYEMAEDKVRREIMPQPLDETTVIDGEQGENIRGKISRHPLPAGCLRVLSLSNNGDRLRTARPDFMLDVLTGGSRPCNYAVVGSSFWVGPGTGSDLRMNFNKSDDQVTAANETNHGLTNFPDAYFWAGMAYGYAYTENTEGEQKAWDRYAALRDQINENADDLRRGGGAGRAT